MTLEFRGALNLVGYREPDNHPETFSVATAAIGFRDRAWGKPLAFVLFSGHPERQSGARVAANDALDADHAFYRFSLLDLRRVGVVWLGGDKRS